MEKGTVVSPNTKIDAFQGLRTVALAGIIFYHYNNPGLSTYAAWSVSLFFMLSGYLNGLSWANGKRPQKSFKSSIIYMLRHIKKLYFLHVATTLLCIPVSGIPEQIRQGGSSIILFWGIVFILSITLTKSLYPKYYWGFNGVSWFLSSYAVICLLTPVLLHKTAQFLENKKFHTVVKTILAIVILQFCYCFLIGRTDWNIEYWIYIFPLSRLGEYVTAMIVGMYTLSDARSPAPEGTCVTGCPDGYTQGQTCRGVGRLGNPKENIILQIPGILGWIAAIGIALLIFCVPMPEWIVRSVVWIVPNLVLLWSIHWSKGLLTRFLSLRLLVVLGNYSAYMFLIHPVIYGYFGYFGLTGNTPANRILVMILNYMITFALAVGFHRLTAKKSSKAQ